MLFLMRKNACSSVGNSKSVTFQQLQPSTKSENKSHEVIPKVEYDDRSVILELEEVGYQRDAHEGVEQRDEGTKQEIIDVQQHGRHG